MIKRLNLCARRAGGKAKVYKMFTRTQKQINKKNYTINQCPYSTKSYTTNNDNQKQSCLIMHLTTGKIEV